MPESVITPVIVKQPVVTPPKMFSAINDSAFEVVYCNGKDDWLAKRRNYLGASDAAAVLGLSPWMTNSQLFDEKTSKAPPVPIEPNADILRGIKSEEHIRSLYAIETGHRVIDGAGCILVSKEHPYMSCTLDGICNDGEQDYILEIKSARYNPKWGNRTQLPDNYFVQVLHQLAVTGWSYAVLRARLLMFDGDVVERTYKVIASEYRKQIDNLVLLEGRFWNKVQKGERPDTMLPEL